MNYVNEWRRSGKGWLEDEPFTRYQKLKKKPKRKSNDKEKSIQRYNERVRKNAFNIRKVL